MKPSLLDDLVEQINQALPRAQAMGEEARQSAKMAAQLALQSMDLVSREEFDAQQRALEKAEQRISELEIVLKQLEDQLLPQ